MQHDYSGLLWIECADGAPGGVRGVPDGNAVILRYEIDVRHGGYVEVNAGSGGRWKQEDKEDFELTMVLSEK